MNVLVDTSVWSLALRRRSEDLGAKERAVVGEWRDLVRKSRVGIIGPIRQEVLSGIREKAHFESLRRRLGPFEAASIDESDYDMAAMFFNKCRAHGVVGTAIDMLICAVAARATWPVFTTDADFARYSEHIPIRLHVPGPC